MLVIDINGKAIGDLTLYGKYNEEVPSAIMDGIEFGLGGSWDDINNRFINYILVPIPIKES